MSLFSLGEVLTPHLALVVTLPLIGTGRAPRPEQISAPNDPVASPWVNSRSRRIFESVVAALALVALSPLLAGCWILVRFTSAGPALFRQRRMGRNGRQFVLYKFRSMRGESGPSKTSHTVHADRRITRVGALLRRFKLDELPQFWNVLKGDMSLVGPRPKLPDHEGLHMPYRPGITGEATLAFRHEERMLLEIPVCDIDPFYQAIFKPMKAQIDIVYMRHATCRSDLKILVRTFFRCLNCAPDGRQELENLLRQYVPECQKALTRPEPIPGGQRLRQAHRFLPELVDEFVSDLDDVA